MVFSDSLLASPLGLLMLLRQMPWYLYIAIRHTFPKGIRLPFFTVMSVLGVSLGAMALFVILSVFNGLGHGIRKVVADTTGDLKVMNGGIFENHPELIAQLEADEAVEAVSPSAFGVVMLQTGNRPIFPNVQGIDVEAEKRVVPLEDYVYSGSLDDLDDYSILISIGIANTLRLRVGDEVDIFTPLMIDRLKQDEVILPRLMRVAGVFETGFGQIDENTIVTSLRAMQELYGLGEGAHALKVKLVSGADPETVAAKLQEEVPYPFRVSTWLESNADYLAILQFEKRMMFFILMIIVLVASFSIATSLFTSVVKKTREIGLFVSMGATSRQVMACFCVQGLAVGIVGTLLGFGLGVLLLSFRGAITDFLFSMMGGKQQSMQFYFFSEIPVHYVATDLIVIALTTVGVSTLAGLVPAMKAGAMKPAEALRGE